MKSGTRVPEDESNSRFISLFMIEISTCHRTEIAASALFSLASGVRDTPHADTHTALRPLGLHIRSAGLTTTPPPPSDALRTTYLTRGGVVRHNDKPSE